MWSWHSCLPHAEGKNAWSCTSIPSCAVMTCWIASPLMGSGSGRPRYPYHCTTEGTRRGGGVNRSSTVLQNSPSIFKYNQQDAALYDILYYCQCSTCFRRFLRPSSGAQKMYTQLNVFLTVYHELTIYWLPTLCTNCYLFIK